MTWIIQMGWQNSSKIKWLIEVEVCCQTMRLRSLVFLLNLEELGACSIRINLPFHYLHRPQWRKQTLILDGKETRELGSVETCLASPSTIRKPSNSITESSTHCQPLVAYFIVPFICKYMIVCLHTYKCVQNVIAFWHILALIFSYSYTYHIIFT